MVRSIGTTSGRNSDTGHSVQGAPFPAIPGRSPGARVETKDQDGAWYGAMGGSRVVADEDLFLQVQQGDANALGVLACRHQGRIYGLACRLVRDRQAAEDLTQETFLRLIRASHQYRYP